MGNPRQALVVSQLPDKPNFSMFAFPPHQCTFQMTQIINRQWWEDFYKLQKQSSSNIWPVRYIILEKLFLSPVTIDPGSSKHLQLNFIKLPHCIGYEYVPVIVFVFPGWVESFYCYKADALMVAKKLLENVFPTWRTASTVSSE